MAAKMPDTEQAKSAGDLIAESARLLAEGDDEAAIAALQAASVDDPDSPRIQFVTGILAWRLSKLEQAITILRQCHEQDPMNGTVAEALASLVAQAGNLVESLYFGKIATALGPKEGYAELVPPSFPSFGEAFFSIQERALFARARLMARSGKLHVAIDFAGQHVALNPDDDEARLFLADNLLRIGAADAALKALRPAAGRAGVGPATLSRYARALSAVGEVEEARRYHDAACAAAPDGCRRGSRSRGGLALARYRSGRRAHTRRRLGQSVPAGAQAEIADAGRRQARHRLSRFRVCRSP